MRSFSVNTRSTKQDLNERNHLRTRAFNGLTSDRYKKADYAAFEEFSRKEKAKAKNTEIKVKTLKGKINLRNETNFIQKQNQIWSESFENLGKELIKAEENLSYGKEAFLKVSGMLSEEDFADFSGMLEQIDSSMQSYDDNIVEPLRCLKSDLNYKVHDQKLIEEEELKEIRKIVEDVKYQAFHLLRQLEEESGEIQQQVDAYNSNQQISKDLFDPPPMEEIFSLEVLQMIEEFDVGQLFLTQLMQLYSKYGDYFDENNRKIEEIKTQLEISLWSCKELLILTTIIDLYRRYTPEYLSNRNSSSLQLDMLARLLPKKSKLEIVEAESLVIRKRYFSKRLSGLHEELCVEVSTFRNRSMNILYEKSEKYLADNAIEYTRQEQQQICQQLHNELQELREKKAEIERLEEMIASKEREKIEEEKRKENELESKRRNKGHSDIAAYKRRKSAAREHERAKMEAKLQQLKAELKEQEKLDRERIKYREEKYEEKLQMQADKRRLLELEEIEKEERLDALRKTVGITAEADPARMVQNTICYEAKMGIGINQDLDLQAPMFKVHGFSDEKIKSDPRLRVERELRRMHLHGTDYGRAILSRIAPPTKPRPDSFSTGYQSTLNKDN